MSITFQDIMPSIVPLLFFAVVWVGFFLVFGGMLIERKGVSNWWLLGFMIPSLNLFFLYWVAAMPDKAVLNRLEELENLLKEANP